MNAPFDTQVSPSVARRRLAEYQRQSKIFNHRSRTIGVDVDALNTQVYNDNVRKAQMKIEEDFLSNEILRHDRLAVIAGIQHDREVRRINKEFSDFQLKERKPDGSTAFKKQDLPIWECDPTVRNDSHCGVSCVQEMLGEDVNYEDRKKRTQKQLRTWLGQQLSDKAVQLEKDKTELLEWEIWAERRNKNELEAEKNDRESRKKERDDVSLYNKFAAGTVKLLKTEQELLDEIQKVQDIQNNYNSDFLSENPSAAVNSLDPCRILPNRWKGWTKAQIDEYYRELKEQIAENQYRKEIDLREKEQVEMAWKSRIRDGVLLERKEKRDLFAENRKLFFENQELAKVQKERKEHLKKSVTVTDDDFFRQFSSVTR